MSDAESDTKTGYTTEQLASLRTQAEAILREHVHADYKDKNRQQKVINSDFRNLEKALGINDLPKGNQTYLSQMVTWLQNFVDGVAQKKDLIGKKEVSWEQIKPVITAEASGIAEKLKTQHAAHYANADATLNPDDAYELQGLAQKEVKTFLEPYREEYPQFALQLKLLEAPLREQALAALDEQNENVQRLKAEAAKKITSNDPPPYDPKNEGGDLMDPPPTAPQAEIYFAIGISGILEVLDHQLKHVTITNANTDLGKLITRGDLGIETPLKNILSHMKDDEIKIPITAIIAAAERLLSKDNAYPVSGKDANTLVEDIVNYIQFPSEQARKMAFQKARMKNPQQPQEATSPSSNPIFDAGVGAVLYGISSGARSWQQKIGQEIAEKEAAGETSGLAFAKVKKVTAAVLGGAAFFAASYMLFNAAAGAVNAFSRKR